MVSNCANPKCRASFRYFGSGQLFMAKTPVGTGTSAAPDLQWLCDNCVDDFMVEELHPVAPVNASFSPLHDPSLHERNGDQEVLIDCANSACSAIFISPNQGKLFKFNGSKQVHSHNDRPSPVRQPGPDEREAWYWLCDGCSRHMTVRLVKGRAEAVPVRHIMAA
ncbi:MAG: hypothetical protein JWO13_3655 [Acidobacteriales bacterium]|nr:hypothetical protein [Terriglobales bacterium]